MHGLDVPLPADPSPAQAADSEPLLRAHDLWLTVPVGPQAVNQGAGSEDPGIQRRTLDIVCGASLEISAGSSVGIVGPSGSGKTSLLMLLSGLERPSRGSVVIDGTDLASLDEDERARFRGSNIGIVFQSFHLIPTMTALENVVVPLELAGRRDAGSRARDALAQVGLAHRLTHRPSRLSGGEQQRVALARALAPRPKLLLADEPTGNLDQKTGTMIADLMFGLQRDLGTSLILITHDTSLASRCGRILSVADGKLTEAQA